MASGTCRFVEKGKTMIPASLRRGLERAQRLLRKHAKPSTSLVDELIAERQRPLGMNKAVLDASGPSRCAEAQRC